MQTVESYGHNSGSIMLFIPTIKPFGYITLHNCAEKIVSAHLRVGSASPERVGQGEVGRVTRRVHMVATRLGCKRVMVGPGVPPLTLTAWTGLENTTLTL